MGVGSSVPWASLPGLEFSDDPLDLDGLGLDEPEPETATASEDDLFLFGDDDPDPPVSRVSLRAYQQAASDATIEDMDAGGESGLVVLPTGTGKCVDPDTLVWSGGLVRFGDLFNFGDSIQGPHGLEKVRGWYDDGLRTGFKVHLECGLEIDGTPAHRVWVRNTNGYEGWRRLGELDPNDYLAIARGQADFGSREMPLDEAYTLGLTIADGCLVECGSSQRLQIDKQRPVLEAVVSTMAHWRALARGQSDRPVGIDDLSENHAVAMIHAPAILEMFSERYGITRLGYSPERQVPDSVLCGTREVVTAFLKGYFDGDGYCSPYPVVSTSSPVLASQVHALLTGLGIYAARRVKMTDCLPAHVITIRDVDRFADLIGFTAYGLTKDRALDRLLEKNRNPNMDTVPGVGGLLRSLASRVPQKWKRSDAWKHVDAYYSGDKLPGYSTLKELHDAAPDCDEKSEIGRILRDHRAWSRIESVDPSTIHRIDCEVENQHAFIGNGVINHNTVIMTDISKRLVSRNMRVLFLAHRKTLLYQAVDKMAQQGVAAVLEQAQKHKAYQKTRQIGAARVVVASAQTLRGKRLLMWPRNYFDLIMVDEAHRRPCDMYDRIFNHFKPKYVLGVTATPESSSGVNLGRYFKKLLATLTLWEAIEQKHLAPLDIRTIPTGIDLSKVRTLCGDLKDGDLEDALLPYVEPLANAISERIGDRQGMIFTPGVKFAEAMASALRYLRKPDGTLLAAEAVSGSSANREAVLGNEDGSDLGSFQRGETQIVCVSDLLNEGYDAPWVEFIALLRPTKSRVVITQQVGRGTRKHIFMDGRVKQDCLVLDFECLSGKHKLVRPIDLFDDSADDDELTAIARLLISRGDTGDPVEAFRLAALEKARRQAEAEQKRIEREEARLVQAQDQEDERQRIAKAQLQVKIRQRQTFFEERRYQPVTMKEALGVSDYDPVPGRARRPSTPGQREALARAKVKDPEQYDFLVASRMLGAIAKRKGKGLATPAQLQHLVRYLPEKDARKLTMKQASAFLDEQWGPRDQSGPTIPPPRPRLTPPWE